MIPSERVLGTLRIFTVGNEPIVRMSLRQDLYGVGVDAQSSGTSNDLAELNYEPLATNRLCVGASTIDFEASTTSPIRATSASSSGTRAD